MATMVSRIELKLNGRHWGETWRFRTTKFVSFQHPRWPPRWEALEQHRDSELLNHFVTISTMAATAAILKSFTCQLMPWSVDHGPSLIRCLSATFHIFDISIRIISMMAIMAAILKVFNCYPVPNRASDGAETWWTALG